MEVNLLNLKLSTNLRNLEDNEYSYAHYKQSKSIISSCPQLTES